MVPMSRLHSPRPRFSGDSQHSLGSRARLTVPHNTDAEMRGPEMALMETQFVARLGLELGTSSWDSFLCAATNVLPKRETGLSPLPLESGHDVHLVGLRFGGNDSGFEGLSAEALRKVHVIAKSSQTAPGVWQPHHPLWPQLYIAICSLGARGAVCARYLISSGMGIRRHGKPKGCGKHAPSMLRAVRHQLWLPGILPGEVMAGVLWLKGWGGWQPSL